MQETCNNSSSRNSIQQHKNKQHRIRAAKYHFSFVLYKLYEEKINFCADGHLFGPYSVMLSCCSGRWTARGKHLSALYEEICGRITQTKSQIIAHDLSFASKYTRSRRLHLNSNCVTLAPAAASHAKRVYFFRWLLDFCTKSILSCNVNFFCCTHNVSNYVWSRYFLIGVPALISALFRSFSTLGTRKKCFMAWKMKNRVVDTWNAEERQRESQRRREKEEKRKKAEAIDRNINEIIVANFKEPWPYLRRNSATNKKTPARIFAILSWLSISPEKKSNTQLKLVKRCSISHIQPLYRAPLSTWTAFLHKIFSFRRKSPHVCD